MIYYVTPQQPSNSLYLELDLAFRIVESSILAVILAIVKYNDSLYDELSLQIFNGVLLIYADESATGTMNQVQPRIPLQFLDPRASHLSAKEAVSSVINLVGRASIQVLDIKAIRYIDS